MLWCVLDSNWREIEVALDGLVSQEREASTGDSQKGIHNGSICSVYAFLRQHRTYNSLEVWGLKQMGTSYVDTSEIISRVVLWLKACGVLAWQVYIILMF